MDSYTFRTEHSCDVAYNWFLDLTSGGNEDIGSGVGQSFDPRCALTNHFSPIQPYGTKIDSLVALLKALLTKKVD